ncbi:MAG: hypothetical protein RLZZ210_1657, partial [Pseudomonadota bacterium]
ERIARFFLSVLLDKEIEVDSFKPQEISLRNQNPDAKTGFSTPRLDFIATILEKTTHPETQQIIIKRKKVLIELQQCFYESDITRFRSYLGKNYTYQDIHNNQKEDLEIIAIYILGFSIKTPVAVIQTSNELIDANTKQKINITKDDVEWIAKLNHQSIFIDTTKLESKVQTRVEKLLAVFNPKYKDKTNASITIPDDIANQIKTLSTANENENPIIKKLENGLLDHEILYAIDQQEKHYNHMKNLEDIARFEGKAEGKTEGKHEATLEIARNMKKSNISLEVITQLTGLNAEDINKL